MSDDLKRLANAHGNELINECCEILKLDSRKLSLGKFDCLEVDQMLSDLKLIRNENEFYKDFLYDHDHKGKITQNSIEEALISRSCYLQNLGKFYRNFRKSSDAVDEFGSIWDIKRIISVVNGRPLDMEHMIKKISLQYELKRRLILDITHCTEVDKMRMLNKIRELNIIQDSIIVDRNNPSRSLSIKSFHKYTRIK